MTLQQRIEELKPLCESWSRSSKKRAPKDLIDSVVALMPHFTDKEISEGLGLNLKTIGTWRGRYFEVEGESSNFEGNGQSDCPTMASMDSKIEETPKNNVIRGQFPQYPSRPLQTFVYQVEVNGFGFNPQPSKHPMPSKSTSNSIEDSNQIEGELGGLKRSSSKPPSKSGRSFKIASRVRWGHFLYMGMLGSVTAFLTGLQVLLMIETLSELDLSTAYAVPIAIATEASLLTLAWLKVGRVANWFRWVFVALFYLATAAVLCFKVVDSYYLKVASAQTDAANEVTQSSGTKTIIEIAKSQKNNREWKGMRESSKHILEAMASDDKRVNDLVQFVSKPALLGAIIFVVIRLLVQLANLVFIANFRFSTLGARSCSF